MQRQPLAVHEALLPLEVGARVGRRDLRNVSIRHVPRQALRLCAWGDDRRIEAMAADTEVAHLLEVRTASPVHEIERHFKIGDDQPSDLFRSHYPADRYQYTLPAETSSGARSGCRRATTRAGNPVYPRGNEAKGARREASRDHRALFD